MSRAITSFTQGLKVDPTYVRGYLCRAEALVAVGEPKTALRDLTSAIHLKPDEPSYYLSKVRVWCMCDVRLWCVHVHTCLQLPYKCTSHTLSLSEDCMWFL